MQPAPGGGHNLFFTYYPAGGEYGKFGAEVIAVAEAKSLLLDAVQLALLVLAAAGLFYFVPNTAVKWRHALAGGLFVGIAIEVAKKALAWYVAAAPALTSVYGAFSIVPILLLWVYLLWVVVLLGAVIAAYAPVLLGRAVRPWTGPGDEFRQALGTSVRRMAWLRRLPADRRWGRDLQRARLAYDLLAAAGPA
jgi:hypothetical protein